MKRLFKHLPLLIIFVLMSFVLACGTTSNHIVLKDKYISEQIHNYAYHVSFENVWAEARAILFVQGYKIRDYGNGYTLETEAMRTDSGAIRRYLVTGYQNQDGSSTVRFNYFEENSLPHHHQAHTESGRDLALEAELIKSIEPQAWAEIVKNADIHAQKNK